MKKLHKKVFRKKFQISNRKENKKKYYQFIYFLAWSVLDFRPNYLGVRQPSVGKVILLKVERCDLPTHFVITYITGTGCLAWRNPSRLGASQICNTSSIYSESLFIKERGWDTPCQKCVRGMEQEVWKSYQAEKQLKSLRYALYKRMILWDCESMK